MLKFLKVFCPGDFKAGAELFNFATIFSLMEVKQVGQKTVNLPHNYNPKIDQLKNEAHKKFLKALLFSANQKISFSPNNTLLEITTKFGIKFLTGVLKKIARKIEGYNNPPHPHGFQEKHTVLSFLPLNTFEILWKFGGKLGQTTVISHDVE